MSPDPNPPSGRSISEIFGQPTGAPVFGEHQAGAPVDPDAAPPWVNEMWANTAPSIKPLKFTIESVACTAEEWAVRRFGSVENAASARQWRNVYGEDAANAETAKALRRWACHNFRWMDALDGAKRVVASAPPTAERYRLEQTVGGLVLPTSVAGRADLRRLLVRFGRAEPGEDAIDRAVDILAEDIATPFHSVARTFIKRTAKECREGERWNEEWADRLIRSARSVRISNRPDPSWRCFAPKRR